MSRTINDDGVNVTSTAYKLLSAQIMQMILDGKNIETIKMQLCQNGYVTSDIENTINQLYNKSKQDADDLLSGSKKDSILYLQSLLRDSIENNDNEYALKVIKELNAMLPKTIRKDQTAGEIYIQFD